MIKNKVRITMERLVDKNVTGYEILATLSMTAMQKRIAVIDNPKSPNPIKISTKLDLIKKDYTTSYSKSFRLKHFNIMLDQDHTMKVWINEEIIDSSMYAINKNLNELVIYVFLNETDVIKAEYYMDGIEYEIITDELENYTVKPIIDETNVLIGRHNSLI